MASRSCHRTFAIAAATALAIMAGGCGGDDEPKRSSAVEYVAKVGQSPFFVAVAVKDGQVTAYVCDGFGRAAPFKGRLSDGRFRIRATRARSVLAGTIDGARVQGRLRYRGQRETFVARRARRIGGLYTFTYEREAILSAKSERGNTLRGEVDEQGRLTATIGTPDGKRAPFRTRFPEPPPSQQTFKRYRVIVLDNGDLRGNALAGSPPLGGVRNRPVISPA